VAEKFALLELDSIRVKGKREAEIIFTIVGRADPSRAGEFDLLFCYRKQDWTGALTNLDKCRVRSEKVRLDGLFEMYEKRIRRLQLNPPAADWDGVFAAEAK
jgi:adenylate cyclase